MCSVDVGQLIDGPDFTRLAVFLTQFGSRLTQLIKCFTEQTEKKFLLLTKKTSERLVSLVEDNFSSNSPSVISSIKLLSVDLKHFEGSLFIV